MIQDIQFKNHYIAEDGKVIIQKNDVLDEETKTYPTATKSLWLGKFDNIENYKEVDEIIENDKNIF